MSTLCSQYFKKNLDRITLEWVFVKLIENSGPSTLINVTLESYEKFHFQGSLAFLWEICPAETFYWLYSSFPVMDQIWKYLWKTICWFQGNAWMKALQLRTSRSVLTEMLCIYTVRYLHVLKSITSTEDSKRVKVSQENQLCMTLSPTPNTWNASAWLVNTSVLLCLPCDWFGPRTTETEQWRCIKPGQSRKKEISVSLCTKLFVFRISKMDYRCTSEKQGNSRGLLQSILLKILCKALKRWGGGGKEIYIICVCKYIHIFLRVTAILKAMQIVCLTIKVS